MVLDLKSRPPASDANALATMRANRRTNTGPELALRRALHSRGFRYRVDHRVPGTRVRPDIVFTRLRIAVFVDGCFWHRCPDHGTLPARNAEFWRAKLERNVERDRGDDIDLAKAGWQVIRIWEHEPAEEAARRIAECIRVTALRRQRRRPRGRVAHP